MDLRRREHSVAAARGGNVPTRRRVSAWGCRWHVGEGGPGDALAVPWIAPAEVLIDHQDTALTAAHLGWWGRMGMRSCTLEWIRTVREPERIDHLRQPGPFLMSPICALGCERLLVKKALHSYALT